MRTAEYVTIGVVTTFALVIIAIALLSGCKGGIDYDETTVISTNQYVIYDQDGKPVQVLSRNGLTYINVGDAPVDLLVDRGLVRLESGEVVKQ